MIKHFFSSSLLFFFLITSQCSFGQLAPERDPHRGLYFDRFLKTTSSGKVDTAFSYLGIDNNNDGIFEKEDSVLRYCAENHITYLALYDMHKILGRATILWNENTRQYEKLEKHLCRFIEKAKNEYCITQIGAIGGSTSTFDSLLAFMDRYPVTPSYRLRPEQINNHWFSKMFYLAEKDFPIGSIEQQISEQIKFVLRVSDFNSCGSCQADIDVINLESEFWFSCPTEWPNYMNMAFYMDSLKQMNNSLHPLTPLTTEFYLGNLFFCTSPYSPYTVAQGMDGCNNCSPCPTCANPHRKIADRVFMSYLTPDPAGYNHYYSYPFNDSSTSDSTDLHPLLYSESDVNGGFSNYLGSWFPQWFGNNIFMAELYFINSYWSNPQSARGTPQQNDLQPGGFMWFAQTFQVSSTAHPLTMYSNSPMCDSTASQRISFTYTGPTEGFTNFNFWITKDSDSSIIYPSTGNTISGTTNAYVFNPPIRSINFNDTTLFPTIHLLPGKYTAHLNLIYNEGNGCTNEFNLPVHIQPKPTLTTLNDTTFCEGGYCWMNASGGTTYQWYHAGRIIPNESRQIYKAVADGEYTCYITNANSLCEGYTDTIRIHVKPNPMVAINAYCISSTSARLIANATDTLSTSNNYGRGGLTYLWNTGATTDRITASFNSTKYSVLTTDPYSGCSRYAQIRMPAAIDTQYTAAISINSTPTNCNNNGSISMNLNTSFPTSYLWNNGITTQSNDYLYPGTYTVISSIWNQACTYFRSINLGTTSGIQSISNINNVSCRGKNDGAIQLTISGGTPPYTYHWVDLPNDSLYHPFQKDQFNLFPGMYSVEIFDATGCHSVFTYRVNASVQNLSANVTAISPVTQCSSNNNGSATILASGGTTPYTYIWNTPTTITTATATNLPGGTWLATVTDANGCQFTKTVHIPSTPEIRITLIEDSSSTYLNCSGDSTGRLVVCLNGGTPPYSTNWSMVDSIHAQLTNLQTGLYALTLQDANGCIGTSTPMMITAPLPINVSSQVVNATCNGCSDGKVSLQLSGGVPPYSITVQPSLGQINDSLIENLPAGIYEICISDSFGCTICITDTLDFPNGMNDNNLASDYMGLYPNPSNGNTVLLFKPETGSSFVRITDTKGRLIQKISIKNQHSVTLTGYPAGAYLVQLVKQDNKSKTLKWIVLE